MSAVTYEILYKSLRFYKTDNQLLQVAKRVAVIKFILITNVQPRKKYYKLMLLHRSLAPNNVIHSSVCAPVFGLLS